MLVIFSGLPGSGKTTIARLLSRRLHAFHLRIDTIEQALAGVERSRGGVGIAGYVIGYRLAEDNLKLGATVIADSVNPLEATRQAWRDVAASAHVEAAEVEVICSDVAEHRLRIEARLADIAGQVLPRWSDVTGRDYEPWNAVTLRIDTAGRAAEDCAAEIAVALTRFGRKGAR